MPGAEAVGVVRAVGQGVKSDVKVGDSVVAMVTGGAYAEKLVADFRCVCACG